EITRVHVGQSLQGRLNGCSSGVVGKSRSGLPIVGDRVGAASRRDRDPVDLILSRSGGRNKAIRSHSDLVTGLHLGTSNLLGNPEGRRFDGDSSANIGIADAGAHDRTNPLL